MTYPCPLTQILVTFEPVPDRPTVFRLTVAGEGPDEQGVLNWGARFRADYTESTRDLLVSEHKVLGKTPKGRGYGKGVFAAAMQKLRQMNIEVKTLSGVLDDDNEEVYRMTGNLWETNFGKRAWKYGFTLVGRRDDMMVTFCRPPIEADDRKELDKTDAADRLG
jgi:hypothetical protein